MNEAEQRIYDWIVEKGGATRPEVHIAFELLAKRKVDEALEALVERAELVKGFRNGADMYAPARAKPKPPDAKPPAPERLKPPTETLTQRVRDAALGRVGCFTVRQIAEALDYPIVSPVKTIIGAMVRAGDLERASPGVFRRPSRGVDIDAVNRKTPSGEAKREPDMNVAEERNRIDLDERARRMREEIHEATQVRDEPLGKPGPRASFTMHSEGVRIIIEGDPSAVLKTIAAIDQAMMA